MFYNEKYRTTRQWSECLRRAALGQHILFIVHKIIMIKTLENLITLPEEMYHPSQNLWRHQCNGGFIKAITANSTTKDIDGYRFDYIAIDHYAYKFIKLELYESLRSHLRYP